MLVSIELGSEDHDPPDEVQDAFLTPEHIAEPRLGQYAAESVDAAVGDHVQMRHDGMARRTAHEVDGESPGRIEGSVPDFLLHRSGMGSDSVLAQD